MSCCFSFSPSVPTTNFIPVQVEMRWMARPTMVYGCYCLWVIVTAIRISKLFLYQLIGIVDSVQFTATNRRAISQKKRKKRNKELRVSTGNGHKSGVQFHLSFAALKDFLRCLRHALSWTASGLGRSVGDIVVMLSGWQKNAIEWRPRARIVSCSGIITRCCWGSYKID